MPPRARATAGLDTPASNMNENKYGQETPTPGPRGEPGQMNENNMMIRMMMEYMERQDRRMEALIQKLGDNSTSLSHDPVNEFRKDAKIKLEGKHAVILDGINYLEWKSSILADAHLIQAKDILIKEETVPLITVSLDIELWNRKNELLYTRIFQSLNATVRDSLGPLDDTYMAATIWKDLARRYAISQTEERLQTTKKMRDLRLKNNDFHMYLANFRNPKTKLVSFSENWAEGTYHDLFILGLGDWQQEFIRMKLDEFYATKQGPIQNLNLNDLMDQLATRVTVTVTGAVTTMYNVKNANATTASRLVTSSNTAGADWRERNKGRIETLKNKDKDRDMDKEDLAASQPSGQAFHAAISPDFNELMKSQPSYVENG
ncbi:hypothetical protein ACJ73_02309 [Blastomyces percursus]|uniref:Uncharacterized protein n=1 Tax=Blastomyces percursus TaxID=1658174 RepID=A0A1J9R1N7_9EURO|nr:hypothetical protein ACJ73_02309 [Blastomyces percursus]